MLLNHVKQRLVVREFAVDVGGEGSLIFPAVAVHDPDVYFFAWLPAGAVEPNHFAGMVIVFVGGEAGGVENGGVGGRAGGVDTAGDQDAIVAVDLGIAAVVN